MTTEKQKAKQREFNNKMRAYCIEHHLCVDCKNPIDEAGTIRRCSWCAKRHRLLANEHRKTWSPEKRAHVAMVQKLWRFEHPEKVEEANRRYSALRAQLQKGGQEWESSERSRMSGTIGSTVLRQAGCVRGNAGREQKHGGDAPSAAKTSLSPDTRPAGSAELRYQNTTIRED